MRSPRRRVGASRDAGSLHREGCSACARFPWHPSDSSGLAGREPVAAESALAQADAAVSSLSAERSRHRRHSSFRETTRIDRDTDRPGQRDSGVRIRRARRRAAVSGSTASQRDAVGKLMNAGAVLRTLPNNADKDWHCDEQTQHHEHNAEHDRDRSRGVGQSRSL